MKDWFKARNVWGAAIEALTDDEAGRLMKALWHYTMTGEQAELIGAERGIYAMILLILSQDDERESEISEKRAAAGSIGGKQNQAKQANASFASSEEANQANACNKNKNKNKDKESESEKKKEKEEKERALQENFDLFWAMYPRKESKPEAQRAFAKINPDIRLLQDMLDSIDKWKQSSQWQERQYIPYPATWLHNRKWEDEPPANTPPAPKPSPAASEYKQRNLAGADAEATRKMLEWLDGGDI